MRPQARCSHPGCDHAATEIAVVESAWEDSATGSALMVCADHADRYVRRPDDDANDAMRVAHRRLDDR